MMRVLFTKKKKSFRDSDLQGKPQAENNKIYQNVQKCYKLECVKCCISNCQSPYKLFRSSKLQKKWNEHFNLITVCINQ